MYSARRRKSQMKTIKRRIPVVVLTSSEADDDLSDVYRLHANCYLAKPVDLEEFMNVVRAIEQFWLGFVKLPS